MFIRKIVGAGIAAAMSVASISAAVAAEPAGRRAAQVEQAEGVFGVEWFMAALMAALLGLAGISSVFGGDDQPVSP